MHPDLVRLRSSPGLAGDRRGQLAFAVCVRMARAAIGWTQHDLAQMLGMTQRSVNRIETGHCEPRRSTALAIESLLRKAGITFELDFDGSVSMSIPATAIGASDDAACNPKSARPSSLNLIDADAN